jgi:hypothetical protein
MLMVRLFLSILSLVAEWSLWFPSVIFVFEILSAAVGFCPTVFSGWGVCLVYWPVRNLCPFGGIYWDEFVAFCSFTLFTFPISIPGWWQLVSTIRRLTLFVFVFIL